MSAAERAEVTRWFTSALKIPRLIGKLPSGERIWGGPYTPTQVLVAVAVFAIGAKTLGWWGYSNLLINWVTLLAVSVGSLFAAGAIPSNGTNPVVLLQGGSTQLARRPVGTWRGHALRESTHATALRGRVRLAEMPDLASPRPTVIAEVAPPEPTEDLGARPTAEPEAPQRQLNALLQRGT